MFGPLLNLLNPNTQQIRRILLYLKGKQHSIYFIICTDQSDHSARRWTQSQILSGGIQNAKYHHRFSLGSLSGMQSENQNKGICEYRFSQISFVLPEMQKRNPDRCCKIENGYQQMSQT